MPDEDLYLFKYNYDRGSDEQIAKFFKSKEEWVAYEGVEPGVDFFGFNAYPVGYYKHSNIDGGHKSYGKSVGYLTQSFDVRNTREPLFRNFSSGSNGIWRWEALDYWRSIRCVKDVEE